MMFFITSSEPPAMCAAGAPSSGLVPAVVVVGARDRADADDVDRELAHLGEHPAAEQLADRTFRARAPCPASAAVSVRIDENFWMRLFDVEVGEPLAHERVGVRRRVGARGR